jgi:hypothetical protein
MRPIFVPKFTCFTNKTEIQFQIVLTKLVGTETRRREVNEQSPSREDRNSRPIDVYSAEYPPSRLMERVTDANQKEAF